MKKVTIQQVAKEAGASVCTVSRIMNKKDAGKVSQTLKTRVLGVIKKHNYKPNIIARNLVMGKSGLIGVQILSINTPRYTADILNSLELAACRKGYSIILSVSDWSKAREQKSIQVMLDKGVDGIIWFFVGKRPQKKLLKQVENQKVPILFLMKEYEKYKHVILDQEKGGYIATRYLLERNHRKIAIMGTWDPHNILRVKGYTRALSEYSVKDKLIIDSIDYSFENAYLKTLDIFKKHPDISAIFAGSDERALGVYKALNELKLEPGKDISVIGFNDNDFMEKLTTPLTTIGFDKNAIGHKSISMMLKIIEGKKVEDLMISPYLIARKSCGEV